MINDNLAFSKLGVVLVAVVRKPPFGSLTKRQQLALTIMTKRFTFDQMCEVGILFAVVSLEIK